MQVKKQQLEPDMEWFQIGKGESQDCITSSCLFKLYVECIYIGNAGLDEVQAGITIARRNTNNYIHRWHHPYGRK